MARPPSGRSVQQFLAGRLHGTIARQPAAKARTRTAYRATQSSATRAVARWRTAEASPATRTPESRSKRWLQITRPRLAARAAADPLIQSSRGRSVQVAAPKPIPPRTPWRSDRIQRHRPKTRPRTDHHGGGNGSVRDCRCHGRIRHRATPGADAPTQGAPPAPAAPSPPPDTSCPSHCTRPSGRTTHGTGHADSNRRNGDPRRASQASANRNGEDQPACPIVEAISTTNIGVDCCKVRGWGLASLTRPTSTVFDLSGTFVCGSGRSLHRLVRQDQKRLLVFGRCPYQIFRSRDVLGLQLLGQHQGGGKPHPGLGGIRCQPFSGRRCNPEIDLQDIPGQGQSQLFQLADLDADPLG